MGSRFAGRLLDAGFEVEGFNRSPGRAGHLDDLGLVRADSPRDLAGNCDVLLIMLWDSEAVLSVMQGDAGILAGIRPGTVVVDLSTIEPHVSSALAVEVSRRGCTMLDCPVSGSLDAAEAGTVLVMAGGPAMSLVRVRPVLSALAAKIVHVAEANGSGLALKLAINLQVAIQAVGWGEASLVIEEFGIDPVHAADIMLESVIASPMLKYRVPFTFEEPDEVWASAAQLRKDVAYAREITGASSRAGGVALSLLDAVIADGRGDGEAAELMLEAAGRGRSARSTRGSEK
ncbi:MAG: NAD(P)-dependent oxidoreductase [Subtercola sp.]|nr:NAD(P)-dependent oxidoreductase [Subtercola sp.]